MLLFIVRTCLAWAALIVAPRPSVCPSVRSVPSIFSKQESRRNL